MASFTNPFSRVVNFVQGWPEFLISQLQWGSDPTSSVIWSWLLVFIQMVRYLSDDLKILPFNRLFIVGVLGYRFMISGLKTELLVQAVP